MGGLSVTEFFSLTLEERKKLEASKRRGKKKSTKSSTSKIGDSCSFLEHIRAYQLGDVLGKYKLF